MGIPKRALTPAKHCRCSEETYYPSKLLVNSCRVPELAALLDVETAFPAAPFDSEEALAALARLGMRSSIGPDSILQSAWYIAELGLRDPAQAHDRCFASQSYLLKSRLHKLQIA